MKKTLLGFILILFIVLLIMPIITMGQNFNPDQGLVPCGNPGQDPCTIGDFFTMLALIFNFIVYFIATPLAILMLTIGGIMILISAGNPTLAGKGREALKWSVIGLVLVFGAWVIVNFILTALGYEGA